MTSINVNEFPGSGSSGHTGVVVLGHGSRQPEAGIFMKWLAGELAERLGCPVEPASLQFNTPTLPESCLKLASEGIGRIVVAPYFLFEGNHLKRDIPDELATIKKTLPDDVELVLAGPLGAHEGLVDIIQGRINEAMPQTGVPESHFCHSGGPSARESQKKSVGLSVHPIEAQSFSIIDALLNPADAAAPEYQVVRRVVHATGDPSIGPEIVMSDGAVAAAISALRKQSRIICDVNMVSSGVEPSAKKTGNNVCCLITDENTKAMALAEGITRSAAGIRLAAEASGGANGLDGAVVAIGNAPTALFECLRLAKEEGIRPALVIGVPVGFVGAAESKQELLESELPFITLPGNRGGSSIAVAITNALLRLAAAK